MLQSCKSLARPISGMDGGRKVVGAIQADIMSIANKGRPVNGANGIDCQF